MVSMFKQPRQPARSPEEETRSSWSGPDVVAARKRLGLSQEALAFVLGFERRHSLASIETGARPLRVPQQRLLEAYLSGYRPEDWPV